MKALLLGILFCFSIVTQAKQMSFTSIEVAEYVCYQGGGLLEKRSIKGGECKMLNCQTGNDLYLCSYKNDTEALIAARNESLCGKGTLYYSSTQPKGRKCNFECIKDNPYEVCLEKDKNSKGNGDCGCTLSADGQFVECGDKTFKYFSGTSSDVNHIKSINLGSQKNNDETTKSQKQ